jgi:hypothetical protein
MLRRISIIVGFALVLFFPALQFATHIFPDKPLQENRNPAPEPDRKKLSLHAYLMGWQFWFNDRYSGRNLLIRLKTQIDYSAFSYSDRIYIGRDGWLFYRDRIDAHKTAIDKMTDESFDQVVNNFKDLKRRLAVRGVQLIIVDNELKDAFYPEELPASVSKRPAEPRFHKLRERLARETGAEYVDSSAILSALKSQRPIFHKTDFHWNDPAAFAVAKEIVNRIAKLAGPSYPGWRWPLEITYAPNSGGEASFMPLLKPVTESSLFVKKTWPDLPREYRSPDGPFEFSTVSKGTDPSLLPGIVVFGDSFFDGMLRSGFAEHFQSLHRARIYQATLDQVLAALPASTRFFLVQFIEISTPSYTIPLSRPTGTEAKTTPSH